MIKAQTVSGPEWFTPSGQDDAEVKTRFRVQGLDGHQYSQVADHIAFGEGGRVYFNATARDKALTWGVLNWEHFSGTDGDIHYSLANLRLIPHLVRVELFNRIMALSEISEDEEKN